MPIIKIKFVAHVRTALEKSGLLAHDLAGHNFRTGAATTVRSMSSLEDLMIQTQQMEEHCLQSSNLM